MMNTRNVLQVLARARGGRLSRTSPQFGPDGILVRRSTWKCLARRGAVVLDGRSSYAVITDRGRRRAAGAR